MKKRIKKKILSNKINLKQLRHYYVHLRGCVECNREMSQNIPAKGTWLDYIKHSFS